MKETKNQLMSVFVSGTVLPLMIVCIYETEVVVPGLLATDKQSEFLLTFLMELMTLGCAFLALRLFKFIILFIYEYDLRLSGYHLGTLSAVCLSK